MRNGASDITAGALGGRRSRIWELDFLRGICVLLMVFDHTMYDIALQFGNTWYAATDSEFLRELILRAREYWHSDLRYTVQDIVVWLFALLCGISCSFSKNNFKRGVEVALFAGIITVVTTLIETPITFGILHMFAFSILLWVIVDICCGGDKHKTALVCLVLGLAIIFIDYGFTQVYERDRYAFADDDSFFWLAHRSCRGLGSTIGTRRSRSGAGTRCGCMCCTKWCSR